VFDGEQPQDQFALYMVYCEGCGDDAGENDKQEQHAAAVDVLEQG